ncbi:magnesium-translocating P-type ATPase [Lactobacillus crispatus]|uniref:magnesium-translocating P-type ATPase n=3 Tax=Bacteria TaxID=2 RepID=UPI0018DB0F20|nr:magnesium-translocating P-type ATPase [Lactobacillus crispatus]MBH9539392.1 magnesium-translocating P-type ATPase [Lactobacillus crispatus]MBW0442103.1 magnesium-translocating P-type ATPase [Lactobacillus crispatus]MCZ3559546.1 magnesium-translocating P-type ATPase [Lactobacillus crispatus]MCZ3561618.1 magnesium-translocating P-type ATPase [Lactobacillus crispatus]MCZ3563776.1 magnesium-translocating P-type ATPase [Lactobacillus crispatus]
MLKAASKKRSNIDIQRIQRIARESRSETLARLQASAEGLSTNKAEENRREYGKNEIITNSNSSKWRLLWESIATPFTLVLLVLTLLTLFTSYILVPQGDNDLITTIVMIVMLIISVLVNFIQKIRIAKVTDQLLNMVSVTTNIRRDGKNVELPTDEVVVGDVINLSAGDMIPADMKLLTSKDLFCSSSYLDGDPEPAEKMANVVIKPSMANDYLNYPNILYEGTTIVSGSGTGIVFAIGNHTVFGKAVQAISRKKVKTTLFDREMKQLAKILIIATAIVIPLLFVINGLTKGNWGGESLIFALTAAVGLTPEVLPIIVNSNLTRGAREISQNGAVVKQMNAIQNLGSTDVFCIDKTGTLTQNQVVLERHYDLDMQETPQILKFSYLNAYYQTGVKDLIDKAVIDAAGDELDVNEIQRDYNKIDEIPFDYTRKRMSVVVVDNDEHHGQHLLVTKGAAEGMLAISNKVELNGKVEDLTTAWREKILNQINELNDDGLRVLLVGYKLNPAPVGEFSAKDEHDLTIIGYLAYLDPPKETTKEALEDLKKDYVDVKIFTGDNEAVTRAIALQVGLNVDTVYDGTQIEAVSPEELREIVEKCDIFVRITPELRVKIINALKANGHTVGYMGNGNKDALAMKVADVTVTSNTSVDIIKESADIIFEQKDLQLLEEMILMGRKVFSNTMKYIKTFLVTNAGSVIAMVVSSLLLPFLPLLPLQVLILNLLFSISCLVIPFDSVSKNYVKKPQKWSIKRWPKFVLNFGPILAIIDFIAMGLMFYVICPYLVGSNYHHWVFMTLFYSGIFVESLWTRIMVIHTLRDERFPFFKQHATPVVFLVTIGMAIIGTMLPSSSIAPSLGLAQLPFGYWGIVFLLEVIYILLTTLVKHLYLKKEKF